MSIFFKWLETQPPTSSRIGNWAASSRPSPIFPKPNFEVAEIVVEISKEMTGKRRHRMDKLHMGSGLDIKEMISSR